MTDFRDSHPRCPACPEGRLEPGPIKQRLVCGTCNGTWLAFDELSRTMDDVTGWAANATVCAEQAGDRPCPVCVGKLTTFRLRTDPLRLVYGRSEITLDRCEHHGVWLDGGELAGLVGETTAALGEMRDENELTRPFRWLLGKLRGHD